MDDSSVLEGLEILQSMEPAGVGAEMRANVFYYKSNARRMLHILPMM